MSSQILKPKNFKLENVSYSEMKQNKYGGKYLYVNYDSRPLLVQTPKLKIPFGMADFQSDSGNVSYSLQLAFNGFTTDPKVKAFHAMVAAIDEKVIDDAVTNSQPWFKQKSQSREVCKALYKPQLRPYLDKDTGEPSDRFPPMMRVKVPFWGDRGFDCQVFNDAKEEVDPKSSLVKQATVQAILRCERLWFGSGNFGLGWRVVQVRVTPPDTLSGFAFVSDSDDSDSDDSDSDDASSPGDGGVASDTDSDEEESEEEDEPEPVVVKKKRGRKKKSS